LGFVSVIARILFLQNSRAIQLCPWALNKNYLCRRRGTLDRPRIARAIRAMTKQKFYFAAPVAKSPQKIHTLLTKLGYIYRHRAARRKTNKEREVQR